jgi:RNA polymerase sigma-70 factor, ECF subfamily
MAFAALMIGDKVMSAGSGGDEHMKLLARIATNRDRSAFERIFDIFAPRVKSFMIRKGASAEQAEDLVQETMIAVWSKAGLYVGERGSVATWIFTIARNLRIDRLRREKSNMFTDMEDFDAPSEDATAEESYGRMEEDSLVARALQQIPEEQKQLLIMSYVDDLPQVEIAQRLKIPLGTVKSRMRLAYRRLHKILESAT